MRDPTLAAVLSAIIPGVGQFYNGRVLSGILWLIVTPGLWIGTGGLLGWIAHVVSAYTAYTPTPATTGGASQASTFLSSRPGPNPGSGLFADRGC